MKFYMTSVAGGVIQVIGRLESVDAGKAKNPELGNCNELV